jgi:hypothetical protein
MLACLIARTTTEQLRYWTGSLFFTNFGYKKLYDIYTSIHLYICTSTSVHACMHACNSYHHNLMYIWYGFWPTQLCNTNVVNIAVKTHVIQWHSQSFWKSGKGKPFKWPSVCPASTDECPWRFEGAPCTSGICAVLQKSQFKTKLQKLPNHGIARIGTAGWNFNKLAGWMRHFWVWSLEELPISKVVIIQRSPVIFSL